MKRYYWFSGPVLSIKSSFGFKTVLLITASCPFKTILCVPFSSTWVSHSVERCIGSSRGCQPSQKEPHLSAVIILMSQNEYGNHLLMMNAKSSCSKWPWRIALRESWLGLPMWAQSGRLGLTSVSSELKGLGNDPSLSTACEGEQYTDLFALMCAVAALLKPNFHISPTPSRLSAGIQTPAKWQFSLICARTSRNRPADHEMSSFHHSEMQMTGATIISQSVIIRNAFWKERRCVVLSRSEWLRTQRHEKVGQHEHRLYSVLPHRSNDFHFAAMGSCVVA